MTPQAKTAVGGLNLPQRLRTFYWNRVTSYPPPPPLLRDILVRVVIIVSRSYQKWKDNILFLLRWKNPGCKSFTSNGSSKILLSAQVVDEFLVYVIFSLFVLFFVWDFSPSNKGNVIYTSALFHIGKTFTKKNKSASTNSTPNLGLWSNPARAGVKGCLPISSTLRSGLLYKDTASCSLLFL